MTYLNLFLDYFVKTTAVTSGIAVTASVVFLILVVVGTFIRPKEPKV